MNDKKSKAKQEKGSNVFKSPVNWYIAGILLRIEVGKTDLKNEIRRCDAWENQILIKAENPEQAYKKAVEFGKLEASEYLNTDGDNVRFTFEGLTTLIAVYEELEDGAEIIWTEFENKTVRKVKSWVKKKKELEVFDR